MLCQTLTTAILFAASLSLRGVFFPLDALPLFQFLLVFQAFNSKLGCPDNASLPSYMVAVEDNGHHSSSPLPKPHDARTPQKTHILHGPGYAY